MKILLLGDDESGKTTTGKLIAQLYGLTYRDSSEFVCEKAVYPNLKDTYGYASIVECFADRMNHRDEWKTLIRDYNTPDGARLAKELLAVADMYVGMRHPDEYAACVQQGIFDLVFYMDVGTRIPTKGSSLTIPYDKYMISIPAHATKEFTTNWIKSEEFAALLEE